MSSDKPNVHPFDRKFDNHDKTMVVASDIKHNIQVFFAGYKQLNIDVKRSEIITPFKEVPWVGTCIMSFFHGIRI